MEGLLHTDLLPGDHPDRESILIQVLLVSCRKLRQSWLKSRTGSWLKNRTESYGRAGSRAGQEATAEQAEEYVGLTLQRELPREASLSRSNHAGSVLFRPDFFGRRACAKDSSETMNSRLMIAKSSLFFISRRSTWTQRERNFSVRETVSSLCWNSTQDSRLTYRARAWRHTCLLASR